MPRENGGLDKSTGKEGPSSPTPTAVADHFLSDDHLSTDIELIPLELTHSFRDAIRRAHRKGTNPSTQRY